MACGSSSLFKVKTKFEKLTKNEDGIFASTIKNKQIVDNQEFGCASKTTRFLNKLTKDAVTDKNLGENSWEDVQVKMEEPFRQEVCIKEEVDEQEFTGAEYPIAIEEFVIKEEHHQDCADADYPPTVEGGVEDESYEVKNNCMPHKHRNSKKNIINPVKSYKCGMCDVQLSGKHSLKLHLLSKHLKYCRKGHSKVYKCDICKHYFPKKRILKKHISNHWDSGILKCSECNKTFSKRKNLLHHFQSHSGKRRLKCDVCNSRFMTKKKLHTHMKGHLEVQDFICIICSEPFSSKNDLKKHVTAVHKNRTSFTCSVCKKTLKGHALSHLRIHLNEKRFKCEHCSMRFVQRSQLVVHLRTHTGEKPYPCKVCKTTFSHSSALQAHMRTHTGERPSKCMLCPAAFSQLCHLKKHMRCIHKSDKAYVCVPCMMFFHTKVELKEHVNANGCPEILNTTYCHNEVQELVDTCEVSPDEPLIIESELENNLIVFKPELGDLDVLQ